MPEHPGIDGGQKLSRSGGPSGGGPRIVEAEVVESEEPLGSARRQQFGGGGERRWQGRSFRMSGTFGRMDGAGFSRVWTASGADGTTCLAPCITFALFFVCLSQFGLLAAIGFAFFHLVGSVAGSLRSMRLPAEGHPRNPWAWRLCNWFISFMLTVWLAGGFTQ